MDQEGHILSLSEGYTILNVHAHIWPKPHLHRKLCNDVDASRWVVERMNREYLPAAIPVREHKISQPPHMRRIRMASRGPHCVEHSNQLHVTNIQRFAGCT